MMIRKLVTVGALATTLVVAWSAGTQAANSPTQISVMTYYGAAQGYYTSSGHGVTGTLKICKRIDDDGETGWFQLQQKADGGGAWNSVGPTRTVSAYQCLSWAEGSGAPLDQFRIQAHQSGNGTTSPFTYSNIMTVH